MIYCLNQISLKETNTGVASKNIGFEGDDATNNRSILLGSSKCEERKRAWVCLYHSNKSPLFSPRTPRSIIHDARLILSSSSSCDWFINQSIHCTCKSCLVNSLVLSSSVINSKVNGTDIIAQVNAGKWYERVAYRVKPKKMINNSRGKYFFTSKHNRALQVSNNVILTLQGRDHWRCTIWIKKGTTKKNAD